MTVHIGEMKTTVDVEPEVGSGPGATATPAAQPEPCPERAAWELRRRTAIDLARTHAEGYVD